MEDRCISGEVSFIDPTDAASLRRVIEDWLGSPGPPPRSAWLTGLAVNALRSFTDALPPQFQFAHPRTLRRWWLHFPADLYLSDKALFGSLHPRWHRSWWQQRIQHLNAQKIWLPWLGERLVLFSLDALPRAELPSDPSTPS
jgi:hypothetical protein